MGNIKYVINDIIKLYELGENTYTLAKKFNCTAPGIRYQLIKHGIKLRDVREASKNYQCNFNYFNKIDSEDKAYFLGLLYADGCIRRDKSGFLISLQETDKYILDEFNNFLNSNKKLYFRKKRKDNHQNQYSLEICNKNIVLDLIDKGCYPKKSLVLEFPTNEQVPDYLINHFIRGYFDGDGCIRKESRNSYKNYTYFNAIFSVVGSHEFIFKYKKLLVDRCNTNDVKISNKKKVSELQYSSRIDIINIYNFLYGNATIFLERKKKIFDEIFIEYSNKKSFNKDVQIIQYSKDGFKLKEWKNVTEASNYYKVKPDAIYKCLRGKIKSSIGYIWKIKTNI